MRKRVNRAGICLLLAVLIWTFTLVTDRQKLNEELIRLHVVANSDSDADQQIKLQVRDAVLSSLQEELQKVADVDAARAYLRDNLEKIRLVADKTLEAAGFQERTAVTLCQEAFDTRYYDTFTLPAGVYEALRITIGEGRGQNWWCVTFPALCLSATSGEFETAAVGAGFSGELSSTLAGEPDYEIRFWILDAMGKVQNRFFRKDAVA